MMIILLALLQAGWVFISYDTSGMNEDCPWDCAHTQFQGLFIAESQIFCSAVDDFFAAKSFGS